MDTKKIELLLERYWEAETSLEEERTLREYFRGDDVAEELSQWKPFFEAQAGEETLGEDFDERLMGLISDEALVVKAKVVSLRDRLMPLFKAASVVAIILTVGGALQAPWDSSWNTVEDYAVLEHDVDTVTAVRPVQAVNAADTQGDSSKVTMPVEAKD